MAEPENFLVETFDKKRVYFYECDYLNRLKLSEVLKITSEVAGLDYVKKGLSHEVLMNNNMVFLLSIISFNIIKYPSNQEEINFSTWESGKKGALFLRSFEIKNHKNEVCIEGTSGWVLVNPTNRHIIKPSQFGYDMPQILDRKSNSVPIGKITYAELVYLGDRKVRISDLDINGHMYNAVYSDIAIDYISKQHYEKNVENFRINYIQEAKFEDTISIYGEFKDNIIVIIGKIQDKICFETELIFK